MVDIPFYWVDVFTDKPFRGSPAAVCVIERELDDHTYLSIARELNLRETAFPHKLEENGYSLRWFSPLGEVPICGHATIATAHTLVHEYHETSPIIFHTMSDEIETAVDGNKVTIGFPRAETEKSVNNSLLEKLGIIDYVDMRRNTYGPLIFMVEVKNPEDVRLLQPDMRGVQTSLRETGAHFVVVTAEGAKPYDYVYRVFNRMDEDHGCGTANVIIAPYWSAKLGKSMLFASQPTHRESEMLVEVLEGGLKITGSATPLIKGKLTI